MALGWRQHGVVQRHPSCFSNNTELSCFSSFWYSCLFQNKCTKLLWKSLQLQTEQKPADFCCDGPASSNNAHVTVPWESQFGNPWSLEMRRDACFGGDRRETYWRVPFIFFPFLFHLRSKFTVFPSEFIEMPQSLFFQQNLLVDLCFCIRVNIIAMWHIDKSNYTQRGW